MSFDLETYDSKGRTGSHCRQFIGKVYLHFSRKTLYIVREVVWVADHDEWGFLHEEYEVDGPVRFVRTCSNFFDHLDVEGRVTARFTAQ